MRGQRITVTCRIQGHISSHIDRDVRGAAIIRRHHERILGPRHYRESAFCATADRHITSYKSSDALTEGEGVGHVANGRTHCVVCDANRRLLRVDRVVAGAFTSQRRIARQVRQGGSHGDDIGGVFKIVGRGKGACPGDAAIAAADCRERAVGQGNVRIVEIVHRLREGDGQGGCVANLQGCIGHDHTGDHRTSIVQVVYCDRDRLDIRATITIIGSDLYNIGVVATGICRDLIVRGRCKSKDA